MPLILPSAALLVVLTRPGGEAPRQQAASQTESTGKTKKKVKDAEKDQAAKAPKAPKEQKPEFRFEDHPSLHIAKGTHIDFKARVQKDVTRSDAATSDPGEFETVDLAKRMIGVEGEIANALEFQIERSLTGTDPW